MSALQIFGTDTSGADRPPPIPHRVSMAKARIALMRMGYLDLVKAALDSLTGAEGDAARIQFEYEPYVERTDALVIGLAFKLGWTESQVDELFKVASGQTP